MNVDPKCEKTVNRLQNIITSPNYPNDYGNKMVCNWNISAPVGRQLRLELLSFELEKSGKCNLDYLEIIDETSDGTGEIIRLCGSVEPKYIISSTDRSITLRFRSDIFVVRKGFSIKYSLNSGTILKILYQLSKLCHFI